ncbi:MAG: hypothetical protein KF826_12235 [Xanthobacteraceae bacterium]|nr:hypothetical protein [Xanthobacteraceae bacterium]
MKDNKSQIGFSIAKNQKSETVNNLREARHYGEYTENQKMTLRKSYRGHERLDEVGTVFITNGEGVERFDNCRFYAEPRDNGSGGFSVFGDVVMVGFDEDRMDSVIKKLEKIIAAIKISARKKRIVPMKRRADFDDLGD